MYYILGVAVFVYTCCLYTVVDPLLSYPTDAIRRNYLRGSITRLTKVIFLYKLVGRVVQCVGLRVDGVAIDVGVRRGSNIAEGATICNRLASILDDCIYSKKIMQKTDSVSRMDFKISKEMKCVPL